jgi:L-phenylalanine/L-methionine N-acetyltransferase
MSSALLDPNALRCAQRCNISLRPRHDLDSEELFALFHEPAFEMFGAGWKLFETVQDMRRWFDGMGAERFEIITRIDDELSGFAAYYVSKGLHRHVAVANIAVKEKYHRRGVASLMMSALVVAADELSGVERLQLEVFADNVGAIRLYQNFGFVVEGRMRDFVRRESGYVDALLMARLKQRA